MTGSTPPAQIEEAKRLTRRLRDDLRRLVEARDGLRAHGLRGDESERIAAQLELLIGLLQELEDSLGTRHLAGESSA